MATGKFSLLLLLFVVVANICHCKAASVAPIKKPEISFVAGGGHPAPANEAKLEKPAVVATPTTATGISSFVFVLIAVVNNTLDADRIDTADPFDPPLKFILLRPRVRPNAP